MAKKRRKSRSNGATSGPTLETAAPSTSRKASGKGTWKVMDRSTSIVAGLVATRASTIAWRAVTGRKPPTSGRHPDVSTGEAVAWAAVGGALVELVKVGVRRGAATYWVKSTGQLPPGMKPLTKPGTTKEPVLAEPAPVTSTKKKLSRRSRGR